METRRKWQYLGKVQAPAVLDSIFSQNSAQASFRKLSCRWLELESKHINISTLPVITCIIYRFHQSTEIIMLPKLAQFTGKGLSKVMEVCGGGGATSQTFDKHYKRVITFAPPPLLLPCMDSPMYLITNKGLLIEYLKHMNIILSFCFKISNFLKLSQVRI